MSAFASLSIETTTSGISPGTAWVVEDGADGAVPEVAGGTALVAAPGAGDPVGDAQSSRGDLRINIAQHARHLFGGNAIHRAQPNLHTRITRRVIQARDQILNLGQIGLPGDDGDRIVIGVRFQNGAFLTRPIFIQGLDFGHDVEGLGLLEPDEVNVAVGTFGGLVQGGQNLLDHFEMRISGRDNQLAAALVDGHRSLDVPPVRSPPLQGIADIAQQLPEHPLHFAHVAILELEDSDLNFVTGAFLIEFLHDAQHLAHLIGGSVEQQAVGPADRRHAQAEGTPSGVTRGHGLIDGLRKRRGIPFLELHRLNDMARIGVRLIELGDQSLNLIQISARGVEHDRAVVRTCTDHHPLGGILAGHLPGKQAADDGHE